MRMERMKEEKQKGLIRPVSSGTKHPERRQEIPRHHFEL